MIKEAIAKVVNGRDLTEKEMEGIMDQIMTGQATDAQIGAFSTALRFKGETVEEITGAARAMRAKSTRINLKNHLVNLDRDEINIEEETILDTCGTGGDGTKTFNVKNETSFVAAGAGVKVAKHGNRAVSSLCGSADVLESLGVDSKPDHYRRGKMHPGNRHRVSLCPAFLRGHEICRQTQTGDRDSNDL